MPGSASSIPEEDAAGMEVDESKYSGISAWADMSTLACAVGVREGLPKAEVQGVRSPESISYETLAHCLLNGLNMESGDDARCWQE